MLDDIIIPRVPVGISAPAESQPPGFGISAPAESRPGGIPRPMSAASAPVELSRPRGMISAPAESSRPRSSSRKHNRHGNIVLSAPASLASSITVAGVHHGQVSRRDDERRVTEAQEGRHSMWRKSETQGSALPLSATAPPALGDDGGSIRITSAVSTIHPPAPGVSAPAERRQERHPVTGQHPVAPAPNSAAQCPQFHLSLIHT